MIVSSKLSVAIHILIYIYKYSKEQKVTSEILSLSCGINSVNIRKILRILKENKIVDIKSGVGGAYLIKKPEDISIKELFDIFSNNNKKIFKLHNNANMKCLIGKNISKVLNFEFNKVELAMYESMNSISLKDIYKDINMIIEKEKI
jgi:transcriptional regulator, Rrf2 family